MGKLIRVGITGQEGFMGTHLYNFLGIKAKDIKRVPYDISFFQDSNQLDSFVSSCDVVVHIAAMNRHQDPQFIYDTNMRLVNTLIESCERTQSTPKIIFSSSTQEELENLYGQSKRDGRLVLEKWAKKENASVSTLIIPNVFGPFGQPFHNSFIATFCHQVITNELPAIRKDTIVNLIYVNELIEEFLKRIIDRKPVIESVKVAHTASKKVSEILALLNSFKKEYVEKGVVPDLQDSFILNLFNTFTSFIPKDYFPRKFQQHIDNRGSFVEIMRAGSAGQSSFSTTLSGITRGNHYHTRKVERFAVIHGKASIKLRKIGTEEVFEYILDGTEPAYVDMPIWHTHNITNTGDTELITMFWISEPYNPEDPDTYLLEV